MSNMRVFACGWFACLVVLAILDWCGWGPTHGLATLIKGDLLALSWGVTAVALFGDRTRSTPQQEPAVRGGGEGHG